MKVSESVSVGSDCIAEAFLNGNTLMVYTVDNGVTVVSVEGSIGKQVTFDSRLDAINFIKDTANGMPMQYCKWYAAYHLQSSGRKNPFMVRMCFMVAWATMNGFDEQQGMDVL